MLAFPAAFRRLCVETCYSSQGTVIKEPAAFGRLCVETRLPAQSTKQRLNQPPSGGCVLKLKAGKQRFQCIWSQPPSGGCVLKRHILSPIQRITGQPPSGGCVLKLRYGADSLLQSNPAAFGRLCVETQIRSLGDPALNNQPPSGGCVLKLGETVVGQSHTRLQPPSGGCVLKPTSCRQARRWPIPAAFGRLCVETLCHKFAHNMTTQPPSGGCVLKHSRLRKTGGNMGASRLRAAVC